MATRECTYCGATFGDDGSLIGVPIVSNCQHAGNLRSIGMAVSAPPGNNEFHHPLIFTS